jgi:hypothetical protein
MQYPIVQTMSILIPRVFPQWINKEEIAEVFNTMQIGIVYKVIFQHIKHEYKNGVKIPIYTARVYFCYWFNNKIAYNFQQQLIKKKQTRVVYDDPWFWVILENRKKLSKKDERRMSDARNMYITQIKKEKNLHKKIADIKVRLKDNLKKQNEEMQKLQDFTIQNGLNVPFWSSNEPLLLSESVVNLMNAKTAVDVAEFVLQDTCDDITSDNEEELLNDAYHTAVYSVEQVLRSDDDNGTATYSDNTTNSSVYASYINNNNPLPDNNHCFQPSYPSFFPQYMLPIIVTPPFNIITQFPQPIIQPIIHYNSYMCY